ncbi:MAG: DNA gyrase/topoisomerase IV subunit A [Paramuribaculum sp.]|nr:DNA gyrase/topoisomerase IV subunit A [Paramuribaculum sp.]
MSPPEEGGFDTIQVDLNDPAQRRQLRGMYQSWYLDYASYTILDRAIPHIADGLKPVQRRILHAMKTLDDGRFNKVANVVGTAMQYHPHGDASIYGALVQLGQKELLIDTQGNWGNTLTGASAAAARYIEARLSRFALDVLFDPKVTEWTLSYDGRKKEPVTLPAKFPLLLSQGVGGIAAGLSSLILPHNFNELCDAAISYLKGMPFELYPDFQTGGMADVSRYNDGMRGGRVRVRARIEKIDNKTLAITELPFGLTTETLIESILKAFEKGKIKIRHVDDNTSDTANIVVQLQPGTSSDKTIDALYAFTDCELSLSPNCCVICDNKPHFVGVSDVLKYNADSTRDILRREFEIERGEVAEQLFFASLERIFIEERIYKDPEYEQGSNDSEIFAHIRMRLQPFVSGLFREITDDDLRRLEEIPMRRIHRYSADKADRLIANYRDRISSLDDKLANITQVTIDHFAHLKEEYGHNYPRRTQLRSFDTIEATTVAEQSEKLYINREEGFVGTSLKKDEFLCSCSSIDDIIIFYKDGRYKVTRVSDKLFVGKGITHIDVFRKSDARTIYNVIYQDGKGGTYYMKRFNVTGVTRDREYNLTMGTPGSRIVYFSANPNGEAETVRVTLKPKARLKTLQFDIDFADLAIKGRAARGNIVTRNEAYRFVKRKSGTSTLGGREVWFDPDVLRLNYDGRGTLLGEFGANDMVLVVLRSGEYYTTSFEAANHYEDNILRIEKYRPGHVFTAIVNDADQGFPYLKRFAFEPSAKRQRFIGENMKSSLIALTDEAGARFEITFPNAEGMPPRLPLIVVAPEFVAVKSFKAKGKRLTNLSYNTITEIEPIEMNVDDAEIEPDAPETDELSDTEKSDDEVRDELTGQQRFF